MCVFFSGVFPGRLKCSANFGEMLLRSVWICFEKKTSVRFQFYFFVLTWSDDCLGSTLEVALNLRNEVRQAPKHLSFFLGHLSMVRKGSQIYHIWVKHNLFLWVFKCSWIFDYWCKLCMSELKPSSVSLLYQMFVKLNPWMLAIFFYCLWWFCWR